MKMMKSRHAASGWMDLKAFAGKSVSSSTINCVNVAIMKWLVNDAQQIKDVSHLMFMQFSLRSFNWNLNGLFPVLILETHLTQQPVYMEPNKDYNVCVGELK